MERNQHKNLQQNILITVTYIYIKFFASVLNMPEAWKCTNSQSQGRNKNLYMLAFVTRLLENHSHFNYSYANVLKYNQLLINSMMGYCIDIMAEMSLKTWFIASLGHNLILWFLLLTNSPMQVSICMFQNRHLEKANNFKLSSPSLSVKGIIPRRVF